MIKLVNEFLPGWEEKPSKEIREIYEEKGTNIWNLGNAKNYSDPHEHVCFPFFFFSSFWLIFFLFKIKKKKIWKSLTPNQQYNLYHSMPKRKKKQVLQVFSNSLVYKREETIEWN